MSLGNRAGWAVLATMLVGVSVGCGSSSSGDRESGGGSGGRNGGDRTENGGSHATGGGRAGDEATGGDDVTGGRGGSDATGGEDSRGGDEAMGGEDTSGGRGGDEATGGADTSGGRGGSDAAGGEAGNAAETGGDAATGGDGGNVSTDEEGGIFDCVSSPGSNVDPDAVGTVVGSNGTFTDVCDENGNLVEYECETTAVCDGVPNPACWNEYPGNVVPTEIDCGGECFAGACASDCPDFGDRVTFQVFETDGSTTIEKEGRSYQCELLFDRADDGIDCATEYSPGETLEILSIGITDSLCTTGDFNFGLGPCSWGCQRLPR